MIFNKATVYGGGLIGSAWAANFLIKGVEVIVYDLDTEKLANAEKQITKILDFFSLPDVCVLSKQERQECLSRVSYTDDVEKAVKDAEFIQENGPENVLIKQSMIETIERFNTKAIISSSTSGLLVSDIAATAKHPERIVAGHPYNPVHLIPLVELAKGEYTTQETLEKVCRFYEEVGKVPIILERECKGFICNRIQAAVNREAQDLVSRGVCSVEDIDKAVCFGPGLRWGLMGPHLVLELGGGEGGIRGCMTRFASGVSDTLKDMAVWTEMPEGYVDVADNGTKDALRNRTQREGQNHADLETFRNKGLVTLLKYHGKL